MRVKAAALVVTLVALAAGLAGWWWLERGAGGSTTLRFAAGDASGEAYDFARALAQLARSRDIGLVIEVAETAGADANARAIAAGRADLALVRSDTLVLPSVHAVAGVFPEVFHLVARAGSGIDSPADLQGKRVGLMPWGSGSEDLFFRVAEHYGFTPEDMQLQYMSPVLAGAALVNGELDAMVQVIALGNAPMRDLLRREDLSLVAIDQAEAIQMFAPALEQVVIPRGTLNGRPPVPAENLEALAVRAVLAASANLDPAVVERLTALLFEARNDLVALDEQAALITDVDDLTDLGFALHEGARRFYEADRPLFVVEYAEPIALALSAAVLAISSIWQLQRWYDVKRKNRGDVYNGELALLVDELRGAREPHHLDAIEDQLFIVFHKVLDDIDHDRLATETLPTFEFVWRSATELLTRRRAEAVPVTRRTDRHETVALPV